MTDEALPPSDPLLTPQTVVLVDDHPIWRDGLRSMLRLTEFTVVGEAVDGREAVEVVRQSRPALVLMDIRMAGGDGLEALRAIKAEDPRAAVIMLTNYDNQAFRARAVAGGAAGYLLKGVDRADLLHVLRTVASGGMLLTPEDLFEAIQGVGTDMESLPDLYGPLTEREQEVLRLLAAGLSNRDIGAVLFIAETTVKTHVQHVIGKLGVSDRVQAAVWAARRGILGPVVPRSEEPPF